MTPPEFAWQNGVIVPWNECVVHARSQGAFWGANVFEGVRGYWEPAAHELYLFRIDDHLLRLGRSMKAIHMEIGYSPADLVAGVVDLVRANRMTADVHICVVAYFDAHPAFDPLGYTESTGVHLTAVPMARGRGYASGVAAKISTWRRISDDSMPPRIKTGANYHNSRLAQHEAVRDGYDTALIINQRGTVAEAPGACLVMVRDRTLITPPGTSGVLEGITVASVAELATAELGLTLERREIDRTELYSADEVFLAGTLAELLPITSIDRLPIGDGLPGTLTTKLQELYQAAVLANPKYARWTTGVYGGQHVGS